MSGRLAGKVAIVTGAAQGMGEAEARLFAEEGAAVVVADVQEAKAKQVVDDIIVAGGKAIFRKLDVSQEGDWQEAVREAEATFGKLDILVNNAAVLEFSPVDVCTVEEWDRIIDINQKGTWLGMKHTVPAMRRAGGGSIVNIASCFCLVGSGAAAAYTASKGAVRTLTKTASTQFAPENIRVNVVHPGSIDTHMADHIPGAAQAVADASPMKRQGTPREVAYGVLFLASDEASYVTGADLSIDGGYVVP